jgi:tetratricopeptide (TPR) repeat protein
MTISPQELVKVVHLIDAGEKELALDLIRQILKKDPDNVQALLWLGGLTPDLDEGIAILERVLRLDPGNEIARRGLADLRARRQIRVGEPGKVGSQDRPPSGPQRAAEEGFPRATERAITGKELGQLRVISGSSYLQEQEARKHRLKTILTWALIALLCVAVVLGVVPAMLWIAGSDLVPIELGILALVLEGVVGMSTPIVRRVKIERDNFAAGRRGEERLVQVLQRHLDGRWTLFRNLVLPGESGDIDAVLVGPRGVFALEVKAFTGYNRNFGKEWQRRVYGRWRDLDRNPTRQARRNAASLGEYLKHYEIGVWVEPRVVWAGRGKLWLERPAVRIWQLDDRTYLLEDIENGKPLPEGIVSKIASLLKAMQGDGGGS